jgi:hypothetical protein
MKETFPIEFIGGSADGALIEGDTAPDVILVKAANGVTEIYEKQNDEPPFVYMQIGYAGNETWK